MADGQEAQLARPCWFTSSSNCSTWQTRSNSLKPTTVLGSLTLTCLVIYLRMFLNETAPPQSWVISEGYSAHFAEALMYFEIISMSLAAQIQSLLHLHRLVYDIPRHQSQVPCLHRHHYAHVPHLKEDSVCTELMHPLLCALWHHQVILTCLQCVVLHLQCEYCACINSCVALLTVSTRK